LFFKFELSGLIFAKIQVKVEIVKIVARIRLTGAHIKKDRKEIRKKHDLVPYLNKKKWIYG